MTVAELTGILVVVGSLITAAVSVARMRVDTKGSVVTHFKTLVDTYLTEIKRLNTELDEKEQQRVEETKELKEQLTNLMIAHKEELAQGRAEHVLEVANIRAEYIAEIDGLKRALNEVKALIRQG